jgi:hypothetical protein
MTKPLDTVVQNAASATAEKKEFGVYANSVGTFRILRTKGLGT